MTAVPAAASYRAARIPIDGLHIDVDFQNNYRTFTHSEKKFPDARQYLDGLPRWASSAAPTSRRC